MAVPCSLPEVPVKWVLRTGLGVDYFLIFLENSLGIYVARGQGSSGASSSFPLQTKAHVAVPPNEGRTPWDDSSVLLQKPWPLFVGQVGLGTTFRAGE